ncbi:protein crumbs homolog 2a [Oncorhynchus tshawytscha]|uniref:Protein crumbs homolog 2-like n=1 Tax=Oncorhynchus tshawytscha TaxID=74940 RepID=A0A8C8K8K5_ONCTS|nr:protein crumbs homolog 2a [Oncorhynchus tshawytscha]
MEFGKMSLNLKTVLLTMMMFKWGIFCTATSDKCLSGPCQNGATCVDTMDDYACLCPPRNEVRYMGKDCDELYNACSFAPCSDCTSTPGTSEYHCVCPEGFTGDNCTEEVDECHSNPCSFPHTECIDQVNRYFCRCPPGYGGEDCEERVPDCIDEPCLNNGTCILLQEGFECHCARGFDGEHCKEDVDECASHPCQNGAICMDGVAEFHCFCVPGFQGYNCEIDINECASRPCENNGTCVNEKDRYKCQCLLGFTGVNCEVEIDECESNPCRNGATCHDLLGLYSCECLPGFEGTDCEVDIDECASDPCLNGAICQDKVDSYECDCEDTGFLGDHCEEDIPECASDPCQHGATCLEGVKEYTCLCWPGYEGENCEMDIDECAEQPCENDGECFERSDTSHWEMDWEFRFADAAGYLCQCPPGFAGENCSVNIDECESEPCQNRGSCEDQVNGYTCLCPEGFMGEICEINIDECESQPCLNGAWCEDGVASYTCHCPEAEPDKLPWGGHHCGIQLLGCVDQECQNGATCHPWLEEEEHGHTCLCPHGFYGELCSTPTTFSFSSPGFVLIMVTLEVEERRRRRHAEHHHHGKGVRLRFRTTLPDMVLFYRGDADSHLLLEIVGGGLRAKAFSEDAELEVAFSGLVSDGDWHDADVYVNEEEGLVFNLKGPGCDSEGCTVKDGGPNGPHFVPSEAFGHVYVGGAPGELLEHTKSGHGFVGCVEDLLIDFKDILPQNLPEEQANEMELGCSKTEWCEPDPCSGQGHCVDLWISHRCDCYRPYHGHSCAEEFPSWTYSHEETVSYSAYDIGTDHGANFSVSFFLRSLKPDGLLFQLRRPGEDGEEGEAYFNVFLGMGRVLVSSVPESHPLTAPIVVTTGKKQLLHVEVQYGRVFFQHAGLRYGIGEVPEVEVHSGDLAYVGGLPREGENSEAWGGHFKGCLQDLRLDGAHLDVDAWNSTLNNSEGEVYFPADAENVEPGCISDNSCQSEPCQNGGDCTITWNGFACSCPVAFTGKTCETRVWCVSDPCVNGGHCVDLTDGYECVTNATFENNPVQYSAEGSLGSSLTHVYLELRTRSENAVLLRASHGAELLLVGLLDSSIRVEIHGGNSVEVLTFSGVRHVADGGWHRVSISMADPDSEASHWVITVDGITDASSTPEEAGALHFLNEEGAEVAIAESFTGCLGAVRVSGVYLPFVDDLHPPQPAHFHRTSDEEIRMGCTSADVCHSDPCQNGAMCKDLFNKFDCVCKPGWEGENCEVDTDECASGPCIHGTCMDELAGFECVCNPGFGGVSCDEDLNECEEHGCENGGSCMDRVNSYTCECTDDYTGPLCQWTYPPLTCEEDVQCENGICHDGMWGANCTCVPGFAGERCETEIDECESNPCQNGGSCIDRVNRFWCVCLPGYSGLFCDTSKQPQKERVPWLVIAIPLVCLCVLLAVIGITFMVLTARKKRQSEGAYSPSTQEVAGARLEMDSMLKVPPEERLI